MTTNKHVAAARKAVRTIRVRREFVQRFSEDTLTALRVIVKKRVALSAERKRSLAAYKANLTRGTYDDFVSVNQSGVITKDRLGLTRKR
jgi:hypothetical protein